MTGPLRNSEFCFPTISLFPSNLIAIFWKQNSLFPSGPVNKCSWLNVSVLMKPYNKITNYGVDNFYVRDLHRFFNAVNDTKTSTKVMLTH